MARRLEKTAASFLLQFRDEGIKTVARADSCHGSGVVSHFSLPCVTSRQPIPRPAPDSLFFRVSGRFKSYPANLVLKGEHSGGGAWKKKGLKRTKRGERKNMCGAQMGPGSCVPRWHQASEMGYSGVVKTKFLSAI